MITLFPHSHFILYLLYDINDYLIQICYIRSGIGQRFSKVSVRAARRAPCMLSRGDLKDKSHARFILLTSVNQPKLNALGLPIESSGPVTKVARSPDHHPKEAAFQTRQCDETARRRRLYWLLPGAMRSLPLPPPELPLYRGPLARCRIPSGLPFWTTNILSWILHTAFASHVETEGKGQLEWWRSASMHSTSKLKRETVNSYLAASAFVESGDGSRQSVCAGQRFGSPG